MPLVTSAIAAVSVAVAATSLATVASAVVAVSALVGTVGLAVSAVGLVTKNEDLMKAGTIMGMVGLAGGAAGLGMSAFSAASASAPSVANQFANPELAASITGNISNAGKVGANSVLAPATAQAAKVGAGSVLAPMAGTPGLINTPNPLPSVTTAAAKPPLAGVEPSPATVAGVTAPEAPMAPGAGVLAPGASQAAAGLTPPPGGAGVGESKVQGFWNSLPDWQKAQLVTVGAQGITGLASGFFEGLTAEEKLEMDKLINSQNEAQRQRYNANNAYAPSLKFNASGSGMINKGK